MSGAGDEQIGRALEQPQGEDQASMRKWRDAYQELEKRKQAFAEDESTGFVWLMLQK